MKAVVVYESHWGNTARVAEAIAEGIGEDATALTTDQASSDAIAEADLLVVGAPVMGFRLPTDEMIDKIATDPAKGSPPPDISHPSMRDWLEALPKGHGFAAAFETRMWWSPGGSTGAIGKSLMGRGYEPITKAARFVVKGTHGPLRDGELERARGWGQELARTMQKTGKPVGFAG